MSEESDMDKKAIFRPLSAPAKQATGSGKFESQRGNRYGRKREGPGNGRVSSEYTKKPQPQKTKGVDKRPRERGFNTNRSTEEVAQSESGAELGSVLQSGSKKANLNYLLNFTFAPRETTSYVPWHAQSWRSHKRVKYNKEQFLQANCQFVVSEDGDYTRHAGDPDTLVEWHLIEQVRIFSHEVPSCPICLYPPVAAKLTRCGHIYCWTCIIHYLSLGEKSWRKCPICYEAVHQKDLKSVVALCTHQFSVGEEITMKLMKRERGSTYVVPKEQWTDRDGRPHYINDAVSTSYSKLLMATKDDINHIIERERTALQCQMAEEGETTLESSYILAALSALKEREQYLKAKATVDEEVSAIMQGLAVSDVTSDHTPQCSPITWSNEGISIRYISAFDESEERENTEMIEQVEDKSEHECSSPALGKCDEHTVSDSAYTELCVEDATVELELPPAASNSSKLEPYYFYQASDGQHIYLNSLNARCLVREYGSLSNCPATITASILEIEGVSMIETLRRRLKYLSHLPLTCEFTVVELKLKESVVSKDTLKFFSSEIEKRHRMRHKKAREERRLARKSNDREGSKLRPNQLDTRRYSKPRYQEVATPDTSSTASGSSLNTPIGSPTGMNPLALEFKPGQNSGTNTAPISFAHMLQVGKTKAGGWSKGPIASDNKPVLDNSDSEEPLAPTYQESFGDAIQQALDNIQDNTECEVNVTQGKKKKQKKKLLFTTTMTRSK